MKIRIGTRGSKLARWQAEWVASELSRHGVDTQIIFLKTLGDVKSGPIGNVGTQGVFTKEIQRALLDEQVDLAVHSLKDLPTEPTAGLCLAAVPPRENCGDALIAKHAASLDELPEGAAVATGSARRRAQLLAYRHDLSVRDLRGNVDTRLQKLQDGDEQGQIDAIILAEAGLRRLGLQQHISEVIDKSIMLPAVGQGALGLETREQDEATREALQVLDDETTHQCVVAERAMLFTLRGGCLAPVGAWARQEADELRLDGVVLDGEGTRRVAASLTAPPSECRELGEHVAEALLKQGASELLDSAREA